MAFKLIFTLQGQAEKVVEAADEWTKMYPPAENGGGRRFRPQVHGIWAGSTTAEAAGSATNEVASSGADLSDQQSGPLTNQATK